MKAFQIKRHVKRRFQEELAVQKGMFKTYKEAEKAESLPFDIPAAKVNSLLRSGVEVESGNSLYIVVPDVGSFPVVAEDNKLIVVTYISCGRMKVTNDDATSSAKRAYKLGLEYIKAK